MVDGDGTTQDGTPQSDGTTPEPETPLTVEALQAQIAQRDEQIVVITKERDTAKSVAGNVQKRQSEDERWEALQAGITHTRLLSEAALKGFSETEAAQYVTERQGRDGLIRQVNDIGQVMNDTLEANGLTTEDPRLAEAVKLYEQSKNNGGVIDVGLALRASAAVAKVAEAAKDVKHQEALAQARLEGSQQAKRALDEGGALDMGTTGAPGATTTAKPKSKAEASKMYMAGNLSDADYAGWVT
jgi:hypothetical protein